MPGEDSVNMSALISNQQNMSIVYDSCTNVDAVGVDVSVLGEVSSLVDVELLKIYRGGFTVSVSVREGNEIAWDSVPVNIEWKAYFGKILCTFLCSHHWAI